MVNVLSLQQKSGSGLSMLQQSSELNTSLETCHVQRPLLQQHRLICVLLRRHASSNALMLSVCVSRAAKGEGSSPMDGLITL